MLRNQKPQEITEVLDPSQSEACCAELRLRVLRMTESEKIRDRGAALPSRLHWFETKVLSQDENRAVCVASIEIAVARTVMKI